MEISTESLTKLLDQEHTWKSVPFPEGKDATSLQGTAKDGTTWLVVHWREDGHEGYDGTATLKPFTFVHLPPEVAKAAFLKGKEWLERQPSQ